jgi:hypothetical protein
VNPREKKIFLRVKMSGILGLFLRRKSEKNRGEKREETIKIHPQVHNTQEGGKVL